MTYGKSTVKLTKLTTIVNSTNTTIKIVRNSESKRMPVQNTGEKKQWIQLLPYVPVTGIRLTLLVNLTDGSEASSSCIYFCKYNPNFVELRPQGLKKTKQKQPKTKESQQISNL